MRTLLFLLAASGVWAADPAADPPFRVGVCTHFSQDKGLVAANLSLAKQASAGSIRDEVVWSGVEKTRGRLAMPEAWDAFISQAAAQGLEPMLILDYGNPFYDNGDKPISEEALEGFARYSEFVVRHFKGKVRLYEIWNEWDIGIGGTTPGTAETYVKLLKKVYPRIKAIDPSIIVYGGAMTPTGVTRGWLESMLKAEGLKHLDQVSIHTYNYSNSGRERTPEAWAEQMAKTQDLLRKYSGGRDVPLAVTEMGWPTQVDRRGTPPEIEAAYLARMYLLARAMPWMRGIWWYDFQDDGWRHTYNEHNFGIVRPDLTPKPAYFALAALGELLAQAEYAGRVDTGDPEIYILKFRKRDGQDTWAMWSAHEDDDWQITLRSGRTNPPRVAVQRAGNLGFLREWGARNWAEGSGAPALPDQIDLTVRDVPWLITGDLAGVSVGGVRRRDFPEGSRASQFLR